MFLNEAMFLDYDLWFHFQKLKLSGPSTWKSLSSELHDQTMSLLS